MTGARAFTRLGCVEAVPFVYAYPSFGNERSYYFRDDLQRLRSASASFKASLGNYAVDRLGTTSGTSDHIRAVNVLAYLGDARVIDHLKERLARNGALQEYENHALLAVGTGTTNPST